MNSHKERIGKSRVGVFLKGLGEVADPLLKAAESFTGIEALSFLSDAITTDKELSQQQKEDALSLLKIDLTEVTKRWVTDTNSDSYLAKNIRPLVLLWLVLFMTVIILADSNKGWSFDVKPAYIALLETLLTVVMIAYFGSRGAEKIMNK